MKINYFSHDRVYKQKRQRGETGWDPPEQVQINIEKMSRMLATISLPEGATGLEFGCGAGELTLHLARHGLRMHGVDISPTAVAWAQEKADCAGITLDLHVADICRDMKLPIDPVDLVVDGRCLHCIVGDDRKAFFAAVTRHLKPQGYLYLDTMCGEPYSDEARRHWDPTTRTLIYNDIAARYLGTAESILAEVAAAGLSVLNWELERASQPHDQDLLRAIAQYRPGITL